MSQSVWPSRAALAPIRPELMIGAVSPLWGFFTGAAVAGVGFWWMTRWMRGGYAEPIVEQVARPALAVVASAALELEEAAEAMAETVAEPALEVLAEALGGPTGEALAAAAEPAIPLGGEAAPISPAVLAAAPAAQPEPQPEPASAAVEAAAPGEPPSLAAELMAGASLTDLVPETPDAIAGLTPEATPPLIAPAPTPRSRKPRSEGQPKPH